MSSHGENSKDQADCSLGSLEKRRLVIVRCYLKMKLLLLSVSSQMPSDVEIQKIKTIIFMLGL